MLAAAVGFNEEIWFRGLVLASLRGLGERHAIVGGSAVFGALHLANVFTGRDPLYLALQFAFACLVGLVLAELWRSPAACGSGSVAPGVRPGGAQHRRRPDPSRPGGTGHHDGRVVAYAVWLWRHLLPGRRDAVDPVELTARQAEFADAARACSPARAWLR